jgi:hypothetical protein
MIPRRTGILYYVLRIVGPWIESTCRTAENSIPFKWLTLFYQYMVGYGVYIRSMTLLTVLLLVLMCLRNWMEPFRDLCVKCSPPGLETGTAGTTGYGLITFRYAFPLVRNASVEYSISLPLLRAPGSRRMIQGDQSNQHMTWPSARPTGLGERYRAAFKLPAQPRNLSRHGFSCRIGL